MNQFVAAVKDGRPVPEGFKSCEALVGLGGAQMTGRMDKDHIIKKDSEFYGGGLAKVLDAGLKWTYIRPHVEPSYPKLPFLLQKALNVEHHVGEG